MSMCVYIKEISVLDTCLMKKQKYNLEQVGVTCENI